MAAIEFDAQITNGTIEIPAAHRQALQGDVHVVIYPQLTPSGESKIDELLRAPLQVSGFRPLTREQAHERR